MSGTFLDKYLDALICQGKVGMANSIEQTAKDFSDSTIKGFSFSDHIAGLLFGNVQAGKTAQVLGIISAAADAGFPVFLYLTTDNVTLQKQTFDRVLSELEPCGFFVCNETDKQAFISNALSKPTIIVLKKNSRVLLQWYNTIASSDFMTGNNLFIVDDEADAASPNTLVNKNRVSTINSRLRNIRNSSIGSIYLQVTGTPQALLLQSTLSDFKPDFTCFFEPGKGYLGGDFFFSPNTKSIHFLDNYADGEKNGLYFAILHHLISTALLFEEGEKVCNFLIHPGVKKSSHEEMLQNVKDKFSLLKKEIDSPAFVKSVESELSKMVSNPASRISSVIQIIRSILKADKVKVLLMNGDTNVKEKEYKVGSNIVIGGNILGRGVTFPKLQTLYYSRTAKRPQADTMWQHSRMFGYDRVPEYMAVFITRPLYKLFSDINSGNKSLISQFKSGMDQVQVFFPEGLAPTRKNVIDLKMVDLITGGSNYYPDNPDNKDYESLCDLLSAFSSEGSHEVPLKLLSDILEHIIPSDDFSIKAFTGVISAKLAANMYEKGILIVRRNRQITQGTGSLLSPNDRDLGAEFKNQIVLTMYQITGNHGWKRDSIWIPNIKLPSLMNYYDVH